MRIIGLTGYAGVGKTSVADYLWSNHDFERISFADPIRKMLEGLLGEVDFDNREWKENIIPEIGKSPRVLMQTLGTEWGRNLIHENLWIKLAERKVNRIKKQKEHLRPAGIVFPDVRFPNEVDFVRVLGGEIWEIRRPDFTPVNAHISEQLQTVPDKIIENDSSLYDLESELDRNL